MAAVDLTLALFEAVGYIALRRRKQVTPTLDPCF